jgi:predicted lipoprotein with Yx(FWY)xxD motif
MKTRLALGIASIALAAITLTACAGDEPDAAAPADEQPVASQPPVDETTDAPDAPDTSGVSLATAQTELGTIVVDGNGLTVYMFDADSQGAETSTCDAGCLGSWPLVPGDDDVSLDGVTGTVGTVTATDGSTQLTLNGWPLYYWAGDSAAGDATGQGVSDVWWVLDASGEPIR